MTCSQTQIERERERKNGARVLFSDFVFCFRSQLWFLFICLGIDFVRCVQQRVSEIQYVQLQSVQHKTSVVPMPNGLVLGAEHTAADAAGDETSAIVLIGLSRNRKKKKKKENSRSYEDHSMSIELDSPIFVWYGMALLNALKFQFSQQQWEEHRTHTHARAHMHTCTISKVAEKQSQKHNRLVAVAIQSHFVKPKNFVRWRAHTMKFTWI